MTPKQAIEQINIMQAAYAHIRRKDTEWEAVEAAKEALREKEARENPQLLTLDELRGMDGEPVSCHTCIPCLDAWLDEINESEE